LISLGSLRFSDVSYELRVRLLVLLTVVMDKVDDGSTPRTLRNAALASLLLAVANMSLFGQLLSTMFMIDDCLLKKVAKVFRFSLVEKDCKRKDLSFVGAASVTLIFLLFSSSASFL